MNNKTLFENLSYSWSEDSIRVFHTPSSVARNSFFYTQEAGHFRTFPSYYAERANLNSYLIIHTLSGSGHLSYEGKEYSLAPQQTCLFDCRNHHKYSCTPNGEWEFLWLHFNGINAPAYYHEFAKGHFYVIQLEDTKPLEMWLMQIIGLTSHRNLHSELICSRNITNILTEMIVQNGANATPISPMPDYVRSALKLLDSNFREKILLDNIAQSIGVSKYYLSREFKRYVGQTITEYITDKRINYAKELLRHSPLSISEIADRCGIHHVTHFINLFKRSEGMTPLAFRKGGLYSK